MDDVNKSHYWDPKNLGVS